MVRQLVKWMPKWMATWFGVTALIVTVGALAGGCAQQPAAAVAPVEDKAYAVTPASVTVKAGIIAGAMTDLKVTESIEKGSDHVVSPAKLSGTVTLKNTSSNQTVRLLAGKIRYIDAQGQPIKLEEGRTEPALTFSTSTADRLDPGQDATQSLDVAFPAEALKGKRLKEIRLDLAYIPSPYHEEAVNFAVSISPGK